MLWSSQRFSYLRRYVVAVLAAALARQTGISTRCSCCRANRFCPSSMLRRLSFTQPTQYPHLLESPSYARTGLVHGGCRATLNTIMRRKRPRYHAQPTKTFVGWLVAGKDTAPSHERCNSVTQKRSMFRSSHHFLPNGRNVLNPSQLQTLLATSCVL